MVKQTNKPSVKNTEQRQGGGTEYCKGWSNTLHDWGAVDPRKRTLLTGVKPDSFSRAKPHVWGMNGPARH